MMGPRSSSPANMDGTVSLFLFRSDLFLHNTPPPHPTPSIWRPRPPTYVHVRCICPCSKTDTSSRSTDKSRDTGWGLHRQSRASEYWGYLVQVWRCMQASSLTLDLSLGRDSRHFASLGLTTLLGWVCGFTCRHSAELSRVSLCQGWSICESGLIFFFSHGYWSCDWALAKSIFCWA